MGRRLPVSRRGGSSRDGARSRRFVVLTRDRSITVGGSSTVFLVDRIHIGLYESSSTIAGHIRVERIERSSWIEWNGQGI